jgi:galactoside O-acetyltransferase
MSVLSRKVHNAPAWAAARWRRWYHGRQLARVGPGAAFGSHLLIVGGHRIRLGSSFSCWRFCTLAACDDGDIEAGDRVSLNSNVYLNACCGGSIRLGNDVLVGPNVVMRASDHNFASVERPIREQGHVPRSIVIDDDVWLSANVTVVGGVRIGRGAVVAAGAVIVDDVEPWTLVGGVPARILRRRRPEDDRSLERVTGTGRM